jgi:hypothetical protein
MVGHLLAGEKALLSEKKAAGVTLGGGGGSVDPFSLLDAVLLYSKVSRTRSLRNSQVKP